MASRWSMEFDEMVPTENGDYVLYDDHEHELKKVEAEGDKLKAERDTLIAWQERTVEVLKSPAKWKHPLYQQIEQLLKEATYAK